MQSKLCMRCVVSCAAATAEVPPANNLWWIEWTRSATWLLICARLCACEVMRGWSVRLRFFLSCNTTVVFYMSWLRVHSPRQAHWHPALDRKHVVLRSGKGVQKYTVTCVCTWVTGFSTRTDVQGRTPGFRVSLRRYSTLCTSHIHEHISIDCRQHRWSILKKDNSRTYEWLSVSVWAPTDAWNLVSARENETSILRYRHRKIK